MCVAQTASACTGNATAAALDDAQGGRPGAAARLLPQRVQAFAAGTSSVADVVRCERLPGADADGSYHAGAAAWVAIAGAVASNGKIAVPARRLLAGKQAWTGGVGTQFCSSSSCEGVR